MIFILFIYLYIGLITVCVDYMRKRINQPEYIRNSNLGFVFVVITTWPFLITARLMYR